MCNTSQGIVQLKQFRAICISVIYIKGNIETLHSCFVGFFLQIISLFNQKKKQSSLSLFTRE
jgi:hypothetical protein